MLKQRQTIFGDKIGNCFSTCIAMLLDLATAEVPNFCYGGTEEWFVHADEWVRPRGYRLMEFSSLHEEDPSLNTDVLFNRDLVARPGVKFIASGKSPRGNWNHAVIYEVGENLEFILHDPHPGDKGLDGPISMITMLVRA